MIDRKEQILDVATELLLSRSFTSFSYQDLSERLGISKASIHHHFATKEALGVAVAERIGSRVTHRLEEVAHTYESPWDRFEGYVAVMSEIMQSGNKIWLRSGSGVIRLLIVTKSPLVLFQKIYDKPLTINLLVGRLIVSEGKLRHD